VSLKPQAPEQAPLGNQATLASLENLFTEKRKKKARRLVAPELEAMSFDEFAMEFLGNNSEQITQDILKAKQAFQSSALPVLRLALMANTMNRIRVVYWQLFQANFAQAISKRELVQRCVAFIQDRCRASLDCIADLIGDVSVVIEDSVQDLVRMGELVLLKTNSVDNMAAPCVAQASSLRGWVCRNQGELVEVEVSVENLRWGELYKHKKISLSDE